MPGFLNFESNLIKCLNAANDTMGQLCDTLASQMTWKVQNGVGLAALGTFSAAMFIIMKA